MRLYWKRLTIALTLSCSGALSVAYWYRVTSPVYTTRDEAPLAQVAQLESTGEKRSATRLLWQPLTRGDGLYSGETIHTSPNSNLIIQFEDGRTIDMEPDSLIVIKKTSSEISMDLLEGSLFVNAQATSPAANLVLHSEGGDVDLSASSARLGKGSGDKVEIEVTEGAAKVRGPAGAKQELLPGQQTSLTAQGLAAGVPRLSGVLPAHGAFVFVDGGTTSVVRFSWQGVPSQAKVELRLGQQRGDLRSEAVGENGVISHPLREGRYWWKLVATEVETNQTIAESSISRLEVVRGFPPAPIFPRSGARVVSLPGSESPFVFRWRKPQGALKVELTVLKGDSEGPPLVSETLPQAESFAAPHLAEGSYAWRLAAWYPGGTRAITGPLQKFTVAAQPKPVLPVAEISWSKGQAEQSFATKPRLALAWSATSRQSEVDKFILKILDEAQSQTQAQDFDATTLKAEVEVKAPGRYSVSLEARDREGEVVARAKPQTINLKELPLLTQPIVRRPVGQQWEASGRGKLEVAWDALSGAKEYVCVVQREDGEEVARFTSAVPKVSLKGLLPGSFIVKIWAVDAFDRTGAVSQARLQVPNRSDVRAPAFRGVKVE